MRYIAKVQFESESHDVYTPLGAPVFIEVEADSYEEADKAVTKAAFEQLERENPTLWSPALRVLDIHPWGRDKADIRRFNEVFTASVRADGDLRKAYAAAVDDARRKCNHCGGSGTYYTRGEGFATHGKYTPAVCFRCGGKGRQSDADQRRNWGYDMNRPVYL